MEKERCPNCGFVGHPIWSDGAVTRYQCERCGAIYTVRK